MREFACRTLSISEASFLLKFMCSASASRISNSSVCKIEQPVRHKQITNKERYEAKIFPRGMKDYSTYFVELFHQDTLNAFLHEVHEEAHNGFGDTGGVEKECGSVK